MSLLKFLEEHLGVVTFQQAEEALDLRPQLRNLIDCRKAMWKRFQFSLPVLTLACAVIF